MEGAWLRLGIALPEGLSSREEAELAFRQLDANGSGTLDLGEMEPILAALGVSTRLEASFRYHHDHGADTAITFDTFYTTLWLPSRVREPAGMQRDTSLTDEQQARVVFDFLDVDGRGYVDEFEIEILLLEWGMELHEAQRTIRRLSGPTHMRYSFDDFHGRLKPIWRFGYETMTTDGE
jgi:Ca2+-binding EF-hand superfamily protein